MGVGETKIMDNATLRILGAGSAMPKADLFHTSQILEMRNKQFMIDCGEGAQIRMREYAVRTARLNHIFISHLHGDHCFGLMGLISTLGMMGRTADIVIHSHPDLEMLLAHQVKYFCSEFPFQVIFAPYTPYASEVIYEDRGVKVTTLPLKHRVPTSGFLFEEKHTERHLVRSMIDAYEVPIAFYKDLKDGADFVTPDGEVVSNRRLTTDPTPPKKFAYISDTAYIEKHIDMLHGVDCLYHEATFLNEDKVRIKNTQHSSALQAATVAKRAEVKKLIIGHYSARYNTAKPFLEEAKSVFENTFAAKDGDLFKF